MKNEIEKIRAKLNELEMSLDVESPDEIAQRFLEIGFIANSSGNKISEIDTPIYPDSEDFDDDFDDEFNSSFEEDFYSDLDDDILEDFDEEDLL